MDASRITAAQYDSKGRVNANYTKQVNAQATKTQAASSKAKTQKNSQELLVVHVPANASTNKSYGALPFTCLLGAED
jgi:hypothetical protein